METSAHLGLKRLAIRHLRDLGCAAVATEVKCPISRYRVDVAGYCDVRRERTGDWGQGTESTTQSAVLSPQSPFAPATPFTVVIECKQSRADFLSDCESIEPLLERREQLERMRLSIQENRIRRVEPHLRRDGSSLFTELDEWDFEASRLPGYRKVMRQLRRVDEKLHGETKFFLMARYRLADQLYLAAPEGVIRKREVPPGWGLLECSGDQLDRVADGSAGDELLMMSVRVEAPLHGARPERRQRMLRNIAVAASRHM